MADRRSRLAWRIENVKKGSAADVQIYGGIGDPWDGVDSAAFTKEVRALDVERINFLFNSPGGYVSDGIAMFNVISGLKAETWGYVEGSADSAASFVLQAVQNRVIAKNATMFIHRAQGMLIGDEDDALALAEMLREHSRAIAQIYTDRAGGTVDEWLARMSAGALKGTQYRGQEAVDVGLADEVGIYVVNHADRRIAASTEAEPASGATEDASLDPSLFQPSATSYEKPYPKDLTYLIEKNLRKETSNV